MNETCVLCGKVGIPRDTLLYEDDGTQSGWICSGECQAMPHATVMTFANDLSTRFRCPTCGEHHYWRH